MRDDAAALLAAERRARSLVMRLRPRAGDSWRLDVMPDADGLALLAAARLAQRFGAEVRLRLPPPEIREAAPAPWRVLAESAVRLGVVHTEPHGGAAVFSARHDGVPLPAVPLPDDLAAWRADFDEAAAFIRRPGPGERLYTAAESRAIDRRASEEFGVPGLCLMEHAAMGAATAATHMLKGRRDGGVLIAAGGGNNGGDGLALARGLAAAGAAVEVALLKHPDSLTGDAAVNHALLAAAPLPPPHYLHDNPAALSRLLRGRALAVDALLGTGFRGDPSPVFTQAITALNASGVPVLALDLPSGIDADSGLAPGLAVRARITVTFAGLKAGLRRLAGGECAGDIYIGDIGAPRQALA